jgi:hypothetical protein
VAHRALIEIYEPCFICQRTVLDFSRGRLRWCDVQHVEFYVQARPGIFAPNDFEGCPAILAIYSDEVMLEMDIDLVPLCHLYQLFGK